MVSLLAVPSGVLAASLGYLIKIYFPLFLRWSVVAGRYGRGSNVNNSLYYEEKPSNCNTDGIKLSHSIFFPIGAWTCLSILPGFIRVTNPKNCQVSIITMSLAHEVDFK